MRDWANLILEFQKGQDRGVNSFSQVFTGRGNIYRPVWRLKVREGNSTRV